MWAVLTVQSLPSGEHKNYDHVLSSNSTKLLVSTFQVNNFHTTHTTHTYVFTWKTNRWVFSWKISDPLPTLQITFNMSIVIIMEIIVKCGYHGNVLSYPSYITFMHIYTSIHASLKKFHKTMNELSAQEFFNFSVKCGSMATPWRTQVISPLRTSTYQYHPSMQVWRNFIKQWMRSYPHKNWLTDGHHTIIRPFGRIKMKKTTTK